MKKLFLLVLLVGLVGCEGMALRDAEFQQTPEAFEQFLQKYPGSPEAETIRGRIDHLRFERARSDGSREALREYLTLHPEGSHADEAQDAEDDLAWKDAEAAETVEIYQAYLDSHPDGRWVEKAREAHAALAYRPLVRLENLQTERVNMANDPEGPLNGWLLRADVINGGERVLRVVEVGIDYLDGTGAPLKTDTWWAVAPNLGGFPTPPAMKPALKPGDTRQLRFTTAEAPEGWTAPSFGLRITELDFVD